MITFFYEENYDNEYLLNIQCFQKLQHKNSKYCLTIYKKETLQSNIKLILANKKMVYPIFPYFLDNSPTCYKKNYFYHINIFGGYN